MNQLIITTFIVVSLSALVGCEDKELLKTIEGLQEQNRVLGDEIKFKEAQIATLSSESEDRIAELQRLHEQELAASDSRASKLSLQNSQLEKELMVLRETKNREPRIENAIASRFHVERMIYFIFILITVGIVVLFAYRYFHLRSLVQTYVLNRSTQITKHGDHEPV